MKILRRNTRETIEEEKDGREGESACASEKIGEKIHARESESEKERRERDRGKGREREFDRVGE